jgi:hypothetical protein
MSTSDGPFEAYPGVPDEAEPIPGNRLDEGPHARILRLPAPSDRLPRRTTGGVAAPVSGAGSVRGDRRLVRSAALGDDDAWGLLVDAYADLVWQTCREHSLRRDESAAVCEVVWMNLLDALPVLGDRPVKAWLLDHAAVEAERALARVHPSLVRSAPGRERRHAPRVAYR